MAAVGIARNSVFALVPEVTEGTPVAPSSADQFVPLRSGFTMEYAVETLENEELLADIGAAKPNKGKESVNGEHTAYLKASGTPGTAPELDIMYQSVLGGKSVASTEYNTVSSSTTAIVKVDTGEGSTFEQGEALLVKNGAGYEIRNISSIATNDLSVNFLLNNAPGTGVDLGRAVLYKPGSTFPSFTAWLYNGNGHAVEMASGDQLTELSLEFNVNEYASASFSYQGIKYHFNPIEITASTDTIDWEDDGGVEQATIAAKIYRTPQELATALQDAMNAQTAETITVSYSNVTGKFTIAASGALFELPWNTGAGTAQSIGTKLGFSVAADDTGALSYISDNAQSYAAPYTPSYDAVDPIVVKDAELMIGTQDQNICVCARTVTVTIAKEVTDADCICEETGTKEKVATSRAVTLEAEFFLNKYDVQMVDQLINNTTISAMLNVGPKSGGNWIPGKCVNVYLKNAAITSFSRTGDEFILGSVTITGFVSSDSAAGRDLYLNFI
jgi:hypothetical protein